MMPIWLIAGVLAGEPSTEPIMEPASSGQVQGVAEPAAPVDDGVAQVLAMAEEMRRTGAPKECVRLLGSVDARVSEAARSDYLYLRAFCAELAWDNESAKLDYLAVIARGGSRVLEARFRLALVLEDLGDGHGALQQMVILHRDEGWDLEDSIAVNLERALAQVAAGKVRKGMKNLEAAMLVAKSWDKHSWLRAKAQYVTMDQALAVAERGVVRGAEKHQGEMVLARVAALAEAQKGLYKIIELNEPEWILRGLHRIGTAYVTFGAELVAAPPPARLAAPQKALYREQILLKEKELQKKASNVFDQGVQMALRLQFESPWVGRLVSERDRLQAGG